MKPIATMFGLIILLFVIIFGVQYGIMAIGSTSDGVNMTGNAYEEQYNSAQSTSIVGIGLIQTSPIFIGLLILITALVSFFAIKM